MLNKRGFTIIELVASLSIGILIFYSVITIPVALVKSYKILDEDIDYQHSIVTVIHAVSKDLSLGSNEVVAIDNNQLQINKSIYNFSNDGVVRSLNDSNQKLTSIKLSYKVEDDFLYIYNDETDLKFNINYSSFQRGKVFLYE